MSLSLVSILIPCHNAAPWLAQTIESALAQTWPEKEIIVIDDGSTDESLSIARVFESKGVQVITQPNGGASAARNTGLRACRGDFIQFLDADDLLSPRKIELQLRLLEPRAAGTLATCRWGRFETSPTNVQLINEAVFRDFTSIEFLLGHVAASLTMHPAAWLVPRSLTERAGPWNESLSLNDDGEYFCRVVLASAGLAFTDSPEALSYYRSNLTGSLSSQRSVRALISLERAGELIDQHLLAAEDSPRVRQALADYWQRLGYELYPEAPAASQAAHGRSRSLGGSRVPPPLGPRAKFLARMIGWRAVFQLRKLS